MNLKDIMPSEKSQAQSSHTTTLKSTKKKKGFHSYNILKNDKMIEMSNRLVLTRAWRQSGREGVEYEYKGLGRFLWLGNS